MALLRLRTTAGAGVEVDTRLHKYLSRLAMRAITVDPVIPKP